MIEDEDQTSICLVIFQQQYNLVKGPFSNIVSPFSNIINTYTFQIKNI